MSAELQVFIDEAQNNLETSFGGLKEELGDLWEEEKATFARFAKHVGSLNYRIFMNERVATSAEALDDVLSVGIPALRVKMRYKLEEAVTTTVLAVLGAFVRGALSFVVAAGKSYLQSQELGILEALKEKVNNI